jgi:hypothetical protein
MEYLLLPLSKRGRASCQSSWCFAALNTLGSKSHLCCIQSSIIVHRFRFGQILEFVKLVLFLKFYLEPNCRILVDTPFSGKAGWENDLSIGPMDSTNSRITSKFLNWLKAFVVYFKVHYLVSKSHYFVVTATQTFPAKILNLTYNH